jgi:hypothetical protein
MKTYETPLTGGCQCGAVRFEARGTPKFVANCHCSACRRATAAAFSTWVGFASAAITWHGERAIYESSPGVRRGYCRACGTPLSYSGEKWPGETHLLIGAFDDAGNLVPAGDAFEAQKLPWTQLVGRR